MNPRWGLATVPEPKKPEPVKSIKQQEQSELYYSLQALKKVNQKF